MAPRNLLKSFFSGGVRFCVESDNLLLLNRLRQFQLTDVTVTDGKMAFGCPLIHKSNVQQVLRRETYEITENKNIFQALGFFYSRLALSIAVIVALLLFVVLDGLIFAVEVVGVGGEEQAEVMQLVEQYDLRPFTMKRHALAEEVAKQITAQFNFVGHASAKIVGNRLVFNIHKASVAGDKGVDSSITATADGVVVGILVVSGRAVVGVGDIVRKGDNLIVGEYQTGEETFATCRAVGEVRISVQHTKSTVLFATTQTKAPSGASKTVRDVFIAGFGSKRHHDDIGFECFSVEERITEWTMFFKFVMVETVYREMVFKSQPVNLETHKHVTASELVAQLKNETGIEDFEKTDTFFTHLSAESVAIEVVGTVTVVCN